MAIQIWKLLKLWRPTIISFKSQVSIREAVILLDFTVSVLFLILFLLPFRISCYWAFCTDDLQDDCRRFHAVCSQLHDISHQFLTSKWLCTLCTLCTLCKYCYENIGLSASTWFWTKLAEFICVLNFICRNSHPKRNFFLYCAIKEKKKQKNKPEVEKKTI